MQNHTIVGAGGGWLSEITQVPQISDSAVRQSFAHKS